MPPAPIRAVRRALSLSLAAAAAASLVMTGADATPAPAPPTPTGSTIGDQLAAAQARQAAADRAVARLNERVAAGTRRLQTLSERADRARADYSAQAAAQQHAAERSRAATRARLAAEAEYRSAHDRFVQLIRYSVEQAANPVADTAYVVLTADSPTAVLDALQLNRLTSENSAAVVDALSAAVDRKAAAERAERDALARQERATADLATGRRAAEQALARARTALSAVQHDLAAAKQSRLAAVAALSKVLGGWSQADPARAAALNARYQLPAGRPGAPLPGNPGHWTPALGQYAAGRALARIGTPYAWAGGDASGPTRGTCAGGAAANDCRVVGFDCSGLALYGWAPFTSLPHLASSQYDAAGSVHPAVSALLPGDLVFWSDDGRVAGIHHVAVYVGGGNVVQAPQSGDIVRVTPLGSVDRGYFGATRPLS